jgi:hypothetical protein
MRRSFCAKQRSSLQRITIPARRKRGVSPTDCRNQKENVIALSVGKPIARDRDRYLNCGEGSAPTGAGSDDSEKQLAFGFFEEKLAHRGVHIGDAHAPVECTIKPVTAGPIIPAQLAMK